MSKASYVFAELVLEKQAFELSFFNNSDHLLRCLLWRNQLFAHHSPVQPLSKVKTRVNMPPEKLHCFVVNCVLFVVFMARSRNFANIETSPVLM